MTVLIVARHGNTFEPGEAPRRVGARTDLPLTAKGIEHGRNLGVYLKKINLLPDRIYTSRLMRTRQMAEEILSVTGLQIAPEASDIFNELDYGPDENKIEDYVIARLGQQAMSDWEEKAIMPPGWSPDSQTIIAGWKDFADRMADEEPDGIILVITSNGIARFALALTGHFEETGRQFGLKMATGAFGVLEHDGKDWNVQNWNIRP
jgi:probable phosphoglycerate mutase